MSKVNNISDKSEVLNAVDAMASVLGGQVIDQWDSEQADKDFDEIAAQNPDNPLKASKEYFGKYLQGKAVNTEIGLVRITSESRGKVHFGWRDLKALVVPRIPEILMTGSIGEFVPKYKERTDSKTGSYEFVKSLEIKELLVIARVKVLQDAAGNLLYTLSAKKESLSSDPSLSNELHGSTKTGFDALSITEGLSQEESTNPKDIESYDDDEINIDVQVLDKDGNVLSDEDAEKLLLEVIYKREIKKENTSSDGFDSIDEDGQWVLNKIDSMIAALQNLHGGENKVLKGRSNNVKTAKGTKVSTVFAVLEADKIIASHTATGAENPNYPQELQPRDRSRESSQAWVQKTSNTLDPESLGRSGRADTGAPIVGDDLVVESGNGRTMAIQLAYERGNADEYKQWLIDEAEYFGFNADAIAQFNQPILVRIRTSEVDRVQFTVEANQDDKLSFSATERAKSDAKRLDENLLSLFMPGDDGDLLTVANQKFIQGFLKSLGETEAAQYITKDGKPTQALVTRIKAAIFSKAYNDDRLLEMMADQTKPDLQNMLNALGAAAPKFIEAQSVSRGNVQDVSSSIVDGIEQALDKRVANAIIDAANTILAAKHNDQDIAEFVKQQGLFGDLGEGVPELAIFLSKNSRSAKKMSLLFKAMAEFAEKQALDQQNIGLFGDPEPVSIKDAIDYAVNIIEENYGENTNLSMFDSVDSIFTPTSFDQKAHEAATSPLNDLEQPSTEQKQSGEYQKGHLSIGDLNIAIENPAGSFRSGIDAQGNEWRIRMQHHYGFIENTMGADGDEIDVFVKNHLDHIPDHAYIIKQLDKDGKFDEHKVILGAETEDEAKEIYLSNYEQGWQGFGDIKRISMADLLQKIQHTWSGFDSWATDGSYEHIPLNKIITDNAPKIHESKISKEDPIVVIEKLGKYHLIVGLGRLALAKQRRESFIPAIIFDANEVKDSIIQKAMKKAGVIVDPVALAALIVDELEKSLLHSFDSIEGNVTRDNVLDVIDQLIETVERFEIEQHQDQPHTHDEKQALELFESLGREGVMQRHEAIISIAQKRMDEWIKKQGGFDDSNLTAIDYMTDDERTEFHLLNLALSLGVNTQKEAQQKVQERLATRRGKNGITHIEGKQSEITTNDVVEESFSKAEANTEVSDADDHSVLGKMKTKLARLESEFDMIFSDQPFMGHGGTPFILDNSKGRQMKRNHDKREERLQAKKKQIEDQKEKIQNMEWRIASRNTQTKKSAKFIEKNPIHQGLFELEKLGLVKQWRKNPQYFFVNDLDKVALATFDGEIGFSKRFPVKTQAELDTVKALVAQANAFENVA